MNKRIVGFHLSIKGAHTNIALLKLYFDSLSLSDPTFLSSNDLSVDFKLRSKIYKDEEIVFLGFYEGATNNDIFQLIGFSNIPNLLVDLKEIEIDTISEFPTKMNPGIKLMHNIFLSDKIDNVMDSCMFENKDNINIHPLDPEVSLYGKKEIVNNLRMHPFSYIPLIDLLLEYYQIELTQEDSVYKLEYQRILGEL